MKVGLEMGGASDTGKCRRFCFGGEKSRLTPPNFNYTPRGLYSSNPPPRADPLAREKVKAEAGQTRPFVPISVPSSHPNLGDEAHSMACAIRVTLHETASNQNV